MRCLAPALAACIVGGCYELPHPVFETGHRAPITGTYQCQGLMHASRETITETSTGLIWKDYRYANGSKEILTLRKMPGTHYAAEFQTDRGTTLAFLDVASPQHFDVRVPDLMTQGGAIDALATKYRIKASPSIQNQDFFAIFGVDTDMTAFITAHTPNLLTTVMQCDRIDS